VRALLRLGFHIVFSDADVAWLQDPFRNWDRSFDLQGLSDIYSTNLTVGSHHKVACLDKARPHLTPTLTLTLTSPPALTLTLPLTPPLARTEP
jgi:hypothetical protein